MENQSTGERTKIFSEFRLDIYNRTYFFMVGLTRDEANKELSKRLKTRVDIGDILDCWGQVDKIEGEETAIYIFLHKLEDHSVIAHEIVHAASYTFEHAGIKMDVENDEPFAYLVGWLTKKVYEVIDEHNSKRQG